MDHFEKSNARREEESIISEAPRREDETTASDGPLVPGLEEPSLEQPAPVLVSFDQRPFINNGTATTNSNARPGAAVNGVLQRGTPKNRTNRPAHPATQRRTPGRGTGPYAQSKSHSPSKNGGQALKGLKDAQRNPSHPRHKEQGYLAKKVSAQPEGLVSNRRAEDREAKRYGSEERARFLRDPVNESEILAWGFYIWPRNGYTPQEFFGLQLEELNPIRWNRKVHIRWVPGEGEEDLRIASGSSHAAKAFAEGPKYYVRPPTAAKMRAIVAPQSVTSEVVNEGVVDVNKAKLCKGTMLVGDKLFDQELKDWVINR
ncbi:hypothetical protein F5882DRAFT_518851 [Hyaloscypha sp. PMI_1271]|nr:hypothetical protein F5882DRAFT_518851 [Hyaloscypha sp. PMI_1271]